MLLKIREATAGKFSYFIVAIISVPFALWGVNYYFQGGVDPVVIEVGSTEMTLSQYNANFTQRKRSLEAELDISQMPPDEVIRGDVISALVSTELLAQEADKYNYHVPDTVLARVITEIPEFRTDGKFDKELYSSLLSMRRQSQIRFEEGLRRQLRRDQLYDVVSKSGFVLPHEQETHEKLLFQERHVRYVEFPMENYIEPGSVSDTETQTYYETNAEQFATADEFNLRYLELKVDDIAAGLVVEGDEVRAYYDDNPELFVTPEQRTVAHILIDPDRHAGDDAENRAYEVYERLIQGEDFAELAKTYSDDSLTAEQGGELPPLTREDLDDDVEEEVFGLASEGFSEPVKSAFGWQLFKLLAVEPSGEQPFEETRDAIEEQIRRDRADSIYSDSLAQLETLAYERPQDMETIVSEIDALDEVKESGWLDISESEDLFQYLKIKEAVYADAVLNEQNNSPVVEVTPGHAVVVRVGEGAYKPGRQRSYEEVKGEIAADLLQTNAWVKASEAVDEALEQLEEDKLTFEALAKKQSAPIHDVGFLRRGGAQAPPMIAYTAFLMPATIGGHVRTKMYSTDSYAIIELIATREGEILPEEQEELSLSSGEFNAVFRRILEKGTIEIHAERFGEGS